MKSPSEVEDAKYDEFYQFIAKAFDKPLAKVLHVRVVLIYNYFCFAQRCTILASASLCGLFCFVLACRVSCVPFSLSVVLF